MTRTDMISITLSGENYTPYSLAKKLGAFGILESASFSNGRNRYSLLMLEEAFRVIQDDEGVAFIIDGARVPYTKENADILDALKEVAEENAPPKGDVPLPASGMGFLSYEFCARCDTIHLAKQEDQLKISESAFLVGHVYIIFDHFTEKMTIFGMNYKEHEIDLASCIYKVKQRIDDNDFSYLNVPEFEPSKVITDVENSRLEYYQKVEAIKKRIVAGDLVQAVPSRRLQLQSKTEAIEIYRRLRSLNPSPYLFYLDYGDFQLVGASPESVVKVKNGKATIRPIAGTRRRGKNEAEDEMLKENLLNDPKELAEHLMLVDLARNDLGRVCTAGSVKMVKEFTCEKFSHVIHIVSEVEGVPNNLDNTIEILRSTFPAGTVSGAPKISAIEILSNLEPIKRNFYAGSVGYLEANGNLDFCIAIRCALKQGDIWTLQAGGGIVKDSNPEREFEETNEKLGAMRAVFERQD